MKRFTRFCCGIVAALLIVGQAAGQGQPRRLALVIGNDQYTHVRPLKKAVNDANAMERELKAAGFSVTKHLNVDFRTQIQALNRFSKSVRGGDEIVLYFAGHGVQIRSGSYLLPVDVQVSSELEVEKFALGLQDMMDALVESRPAFTLVIVDACRDNPLPKAAGRSVGTERGLTPTEPAKGQMVIYAAGKGQSALDSLGDADRDPNGVFTRELIKQMRRPGVTVRDLIEDVQDGVEKLAQGVGHEQRPAVYNESRGNFYFFGPAVLQAASPPPADVAFAPAREEEKFWEDAKATGVSEGYQAYLDQYPNGRYAGLARANIKRLTAASAPPPTASAAPAGSASVAAPTKPKPSAGGAAARRPGTVFRDCAECPELVVIPSGSFLMGSPEDEQGRWADGREGPQRRVAVKLFAAGKYEVTVGQWRQFVASGYRPTSNCWVFRRGHWELDPVRDWNSPGFIQNDTHPVVCINFDDAQKYATWLSQRTGKSYRLLSEAEWEYAARAETTTRFFWGDDTGNDQQCRYANGQDQSSKRANPAVDVPNANCDDYRISTAPVGSYEPNAFGLYDTSGNAWEWVEDCWNPGYRGAPTDGSAWRAGKCTQRVVRGGGYASRADYLRSANRDKRTSSNGLLVWGLRIARTLP